MENKSIPSIGHLGLNSDVWQQRSTTPHLDSARQSISTSRLWEARAQSLSSSARSNKDANTPAVFNGAEADTCDIVSNAPIPPGAEVFNTYGEHLTNAQLVARYGFALDGNENDIVNFDFMDLPLPSDLTAQWPSPDRDAVLRLYKQVSKIFPRYDRWETSSLVYQPAILSISAESATTCTGEDGRGWCLNSGGQLHERTIGIFVNSDAKISHSLWVYCALVSILGATTVRISASMPSPHEVAAAVRRLAAYQTFLESHLESTTGPADLEADVDDDEGSGDLPQHEGTETPDQVRFHSSRMFGFLPSHASYLPPTNEMLVRHPVPPVSVWVGRLPWESTPFKGDLPITHPI